MPAAYTGQHCWYFDSSMQWPNTKTCADLAQARIAATSTFADATKGNFCFDDFKSFSHNEFNTATGTDAASTVDDAASTGSAPSAAGASSAANAASTATGSKASTATGSKAALKTSTKLVKYVKPDQKTVKAKAALHRAVVRFQDGLEELMQQQTIRAANEIARRSVADAKASFEKAVKDNLGLSRDDGRYAKTKRSSDFAVLEGASALIATTLETKVAELRQFPRGPPWPLLKPPIPDPSKLSPAEHQAALKAAVADANKKRDSADATKEAAMNRERKAMQVAEAGAEKNTESAVAAAVAAEKKVGKTSRPWKKTCRR